MNAGVSIGLLVGILSFGITFVTHTAFFLYKLLKRNSRDTESLVHHDTPHGVPLSDMEVTCCMGMVWRSCVTEGKMTRSMFFFWYFFVVTMDTVLGVAAFFIFYFFLRST